MSEKAGSGEDALIEVRRSKAEAVRARGANPFANDVAGSERTLVQGLRARFESALSDAEELRYDPEAVDRIAAGESCLVLGRMTARRGFGKASFLRLRDATGEIQIFAKKDVLGEEFANLNDLDVADHIEVRGVPMVTKTGELSVRATSLRLITKAMRPPPDKWHGLSDRDLRYRRRYVDFVANEEAAAVMRARTFTVRALRGYLDEAGFAEVETPTLHSLIGGAAARPFETHHNALGIDLFLRIAPELYLKRLLVGGFERVYEIGRCYRNEGISTRHNPEFTMLEFYRAYATYETLMDMTEDMLRSVDRRVGELLREAGAGRWVDEWQGRRPFTFQEPFARITLDDAIARGATAAGLPAERVAASLEAIAFDAEGRGSPEGDALVEEWRGLDTRGRDDGEPIDWRNLRRALGACETDGERRFVAYEYLAEPYLPEDFRSADGSKSLPVFVIDYPFEVSPLARRKDGDPSLTDRFELFVHGRELCNAFSELNDPDDQAARFRDQVEKKSRGAEETMDYDEDYVRALEHGMPPAAGFGLGVDRLVMMLASQDSIRDVIAFPLLKPEAQDRETPEA